MAHWIDHVLPDVGRGEQVVHGLGAQGIEHTRKEHVSGVDNGKEQQQLKDLTEQELGEVPVVLPQGDHEALHGLPPSVKLVVTLPDLVKTKAGHSASLQVVPHERRHQESYCLE